MGHGSGGKLTHELINEMFVKHFDNEILRQQGDSALLPMDALSLSSFTSESDVARSFPADSKKLAFTTDAYVVDPVFFPGGNIGTLAVSGTVNDLAVTGAVPLYISAAFILEEGLAFQDLDEIVRTMAETARNAGVSIVTGDTKVVNRGQCDKIFITTTGVGVLESTFEHIASGKRVETGDKIIVNGFVGDHGISILGERESLNFTSPVRSDVSCLNSLIREVTRSFDVHFMRDATRGGVATVLAELAETRNKGIEIHETSVPVRDEVKGICEIFGYDPLYIANEGKVVMVVANEQAEEVLVRLRGHALGRESAIIGVVTGEPAGKVVLNTEIGGQRFLDMLAGEQLPRIC